MASGLDADDYVEVVAFSTFSTSDTVSASGGGTFSGAVNVTGNLGVGTNSPATSYGTAVQIHDAGTSGANLRLTDSTSGSGTGNGFEIIQIGANNYIINRENGFIATYTNGSERMRIDSDGVITAPSQPAFQVTKSGHQYNMPNGTTTISFDTEIFDQGSNFSSNFFTAPVTGKYQLSIMVYLDNLDSASNYYEATIATSNRSYYSIFDPDYGQDNGYMFINASILADMDANDAAWVSFTVPNGTAQTEINATTKFSGFLVA
jgi:hypothetical protein